MSRLRHVKSVLSLAHRAVFTRICAYVRITAENAFDAFMALCKQQQLETTKDDCLRRSPVKICNEIYMPSYVDCHQHSASALPATVKKSLNEYSALAARANKWVRKLRTELQVFETQLSRVRLALIEVFDAKSVQWRVTVCVCSGNSLRVSRALLCFSNCVAWPSKSFSRGAQHRTCPNENVRWVFGDLS